MLAVHSIRAYSQNNYSYEIGVRFDYRYLLLSFSNPKKKSFFFIIRTYP